jgi:hypothetical protein
MVAAAEGMDGGGHCLCDDGAQIIDREVLEAVAVVLSTLRQQAREGEVVNPTLPREVRRSCKEES